MPKNEIRKRMILIVDDEPAVRRKLGKILGEKYDILEARDGEEAVDMARKEKPDLVLMDLIMPTMDGIISCYNIKTDPVTKMIPVIVVTRLRKDLNVKLSQMTGANGYISKPFNPQELIEMISKFLDVD